MADSKIFVLVRLQENIAFTEHRPDQADPLLRRWSRGFPDARSRAFGDGLHHQDLPPDANVAAPPSISSFLSPRGKGADGRSQKRFLQLLLDVRRVLIAAVWLLERDLNALAVKTPHGKIPVNPFRGLRCSIDDAAVPWEILFVPGAIGNNLDEVVIRHSVVLDVDWIAETENLVNEVELRTLHPSTFLEILACIIGQQELLLLGHTVVVVVVVQLSLHGLGRSLVGRLQV